LHESNGEEEESAEMCIVSKTCRIWHLNILAVKEYKIADRLSDSRRVSRERSTRLSRLEIAINSSSENLLE